MTAYCSLTIYLLTTAMNVPEVESSTGERMVDLTVISGVGAYGHAVGGYLSPAVPNWLKEQVKDYFGQPDVGFYAPGNPDVLDAMQFTWLAVSPDAMKEHDDSVRMSIQKDGAFSLICFGDACDLSVYPDALRYETDQVELACHNLDTAVQQLTLLAGLARLCQLVRESS